jgi:hypothetical protein
MSPTQHKLNTSQEKGRENRVKNQEIQSNTSTITLYTPFVERLPTEILYQIVSIYLSQTENIITITRICRRIRQVVFSITSIWRVITILAADFLPFRPERPDYQYKDVRVLPF